jgi:hypothetical protein
MVLSVGLLDQSPIETVVDLPGSVTLPFLSVPCSQTPPESPAPSALAGAYWCLPSFRPCRPPDSRITRLNRFTCVTAWTSLGLRLAHVVTSMSPKARFLVGRHLARNSVWLPVIQVVCCRRVISGGKT